MPRTYRATRASSALACALLLGACSIQERYVGTEPLAAAGAGAGAKIPDYFVDFDDASGWTSTTHLPGASTAFGVSDTGASTAEVTFPGHSDYAGSKGAGTGNMTEIDSPQRFGFGTFRSRLRFGTCQTSEDVINAALGYFNDGGDENGNGITDDEEITFQVLCGTPQYLSLTLFTDNSPTAFRKLSRVIDFSSGDYYDTPSAEQEGWVKTGNSAAFTQPELFDPNQFYELGYEWHADSLRFFLMVDGADVTVWTVTDPSRIPQLPVTFIFNAWHPTTHWYPATGVAAYPANDLVMHVDWFEHYAE